MNIRIFLIALMFIPAGCGASSPQKLLEGECLTCHQAGQLCLQMGAEDEDWWRKTIDRMKGYGADLSVKEIDALTNFMADEISASGEFCSKH